VTRPRQPHATPTNEQAPVGADTPTPKQPVGQQHTLISSGDGFDMVNVTAAT
jgi:hypothetical protein